MGFLVALLVVLLLFWLVKKAISAGSAPPSRPVARSGSGGGYVPPRPSGEPVRPWGRTEPYEVVGEAWYGENIARLFASSSDFSSERGAEIRLPAQLVPAPSNPHDSNAVAVWMGGQHVGYLASGDAAKHFPKVKQLADQGKVMTLDGRVWARSDAGRVRARATINLPVLDGYEPSNSLPAEPFAILPLGAAIQVAKEDQHMDVLARYVTAKETPIAVTLHMVTEERPRSTAEFVEVCLDGQRVGCLSPTQTANLKPLIEYVESKGRQTVACAVLTGNKLKADITIRAAKAHEVDQDWLDTLGAH